MAEVTSSEQSKPTQKSDIVSEFWDDYKNSGMEVAYTRFIDKAEGDEEVVRAAVPNMVVVARDRGIDLISFLKEWEAYVEKVNAVRVDNGSSELRAVSDHEVSQPKDADGASQARDADGEDQDAASGDSSSS